jgi:hypothetical protein
LFLPWGGGKKNGAAVRRRRVFRAARPDASGCGSCGSCGSLGHDSGYPDQGIR